MSIIGVSFDDPEDNQSWAQDQGYAYELWTDNNRDLALHYGAATSSTQSMASRITVLLDADGVWRAVYAPASVTSNAQDVLEDCQILFGD